MISRPGLWAQLRPLVLLAALATAGCPRTPELQGRESREDASAAQDTSRPQGDGAGPSDPGKGLEIPPGVDPGTDGAKLPDLPPPGDAPVGTDPGPAQVDDGGPLPLGPPRVESAFSADGQTITVRYSRAMDPAGTGLLANYEIRATNNTTLDIKSVSPDGRFARLTLVDVGAVVPELGYDVIVSGVKAEDGDPLDVQFNSARIRRTLYLAIVWHQHQPLYYDPVKDELQGPWVRKHATKDYYDMAAILEAYPRVHLNINFTVVLLRQLEIYLDRLGPYVDVAARTVDEAGFLAKWRGHTDPWVDLLLDDTPTRTSATSEQLDLLYQGPWSCVSTSDTVMKRFPEYLAIREQNPGTYDQAEFRKLKIFFELAWFDPDFLDGPVTLPDGNVVDLSDVLSHGPEGWTLAVPPSEVLANRLVAENYVVMKNIVAIHSKLAYHPEDRSGQIELLTTPFYHPILPLLVNTDNAAQGQPWDKLPSPPFAYPQDAAYQVNRALYYFEQVFGVRPRGMWPAEGSVDEDVVQLFAQAGVRFVATDASVLGRSKPGAPAWFPYKVDADTAQGTAGSTDDEVLIVFRDTGLSNSIGFTYQSMPAKEAVDDLVSRLVSQAPRFGAPDRLVTIILDGENAWEHYRSSPDAKAFFQELYQRLSGTDAVGEIMPVAISEYIEGNPDRAIPAHPITDHAELEPLWGGSWIDATFAIWIGETEENRAWDFMRKARADLQASGVPAPKATATPPSDGDTSASASAFRAWDAIYAAEGSDWWWWYGDDMTSPSNNDSPFDQAFRTLLTSSYIFGNAWRKAQGLPPVAVPDFPPIIQPKSQALDGPFSEAPLIDGRFIPSEAEWSEEGALFFDKDSSGTIANADDDIGLVYYGYDAQKLYLAVVFNEILSSKLGTDYHLSFYLSQKHVIDAATGQFSQEPRTSVGRHGEDLSFKAGGAAFEILVDLKPGTAAPRLFKAQPGGGWSEISAGGIALGGPLPGAKLLELSIPHGTLLREPTDPLEIFVTAVEGGVGAGAGVKIVDTAPQAEARPLFEDPTNQIFVVLQVDATGAQVDLETYVDIKNLPAPKGKGTIYIAGGQDKLGAWVPNKVPMLDDGKGDDASAGDGVWTLTFPFERGTLLRYKYTSGMPKDEGTWPGTEEFPLTERGLTVPPDPTIKRLIISDIFADRPAPTGTLGPNTKVEEIR